MAMTPSPADEVKRIALERIEAAVGDRLAPDERVALAGAIGKAIDEHNRKIALAMAESLKNVIEESGRT